MNSTNIKTGDKNLSKYCTNTFEGPAGKIENAYKCDQQRFTAADAWSILKKKK